MKKLYELKGRQAKLTVYEDRAIISRGIVGRMSTGGPSEKTMIFSKLTGVEYKKPGLMSGYLQFTGSGLKSKSGTFNAAQNENTIMFAKNKAKWKEVADFINNKISAPKASTVIQEVSAADEIKKFKSLLDEGVITEEDFNLKKKQLLGL